MAFSVGGQIISVDPGLATGVATFNLASRQFKSFECESPEKFMHWINYEMELSFISAVVSESYIITPETIKKSRQNYSLELIGVLKYFCWRYHIPFTLQSPTEGKSFGTDEKLKKIEWYTPVLGHGNDAARHLLTYCVKNKIIDPAELLV